MDDKQKIASLEAATEAMLRTHVQQMDKIGEEVERLRAVSAVTEREAGREVALLRAELEQLRGERDLWEKRATDRRLDVVTGLARDLELVRCVLADIAVDAYDNDERTALDALQTVHDKADAALRAIARGNDA